MKKLGKIPSIKAEKETRLLSLHSLLCKSEQQYCSTCLDHGNSKPWIN